MFRFAATSVLFVGISRFLRGERWLESLENLCLQRTIVFQRLCEPPIATKKRFSTLEQTFDCRDPQFLSAQTGPCLQRIAVSQRSNKPSFAAKQAPLSALGPRATSGTRPVVMNRRNSLPPLNEMTTVQVKSPYSVSGAVGQWRYSGEGKRRPQVAAIHSRR